ncbi:tellurite resistance/C4-dicarboxylate transporter family protein [Microlunatus soli]|uniref:Tellurite resistance protein TehA n=1 Tax=Microlunatus soli TaxID=630515 RepID=A0A1H2AFR3_9ACTN|nr:tellurite resistance/C4-dicarboxylate transporter family protein [Microlunatus soli]SDT44760.1 Tellurite resistance protein TehA [Microlunatus soli]
MIVFRGDPADREPRLPTVQQRMHQALRELSPGYFAAVMATGIISIELAAHDFPVLSRIMLVVAIGAFVALLALNVWRFVAHRHELLHDFTHPLRGFGFYTFVAAIDVVAVRIALTQHVVATVLLSISIVLWLTRGYLIPWTTRLGAGEHPIAAAANGTWFIWAVGAQSISVAAAVLTPFGAGQWLPLIAVGAWCLGLFLYLVDGVFVVMRLLSYPFTARDLTPPYWVAMGAAAITALAGSKVATLPPGPFADLVRPAIRPAALFAWVIASWLLPALVAMGWWRHVTHRVPLRYDANMWSIVFPLGMYGMACTSIARADRLPYLGTLGTLWVWISLGAWLLTALAGIRHLARDVLLR